MSQIIPIKIPTYISAADFAPARVLPRLLFYNGLVDCESYYIESGSLTNSGQSKEQTAFPYFDNYNVVTGSFPTVNSKSLLFTNEAAAYGEVPTGSLYTEYWSKYISLLYNPRTRLVQCEAIIPLADYFKMELNDIVQWRGNYYHLRAINDYNLSNGECNLQLLGPILDDIIPNILPQFACAFDYTIGCPPTPTTTIAPTTATPTTTLVPTTLVPTTSTTTATPTTLTPTTTTAAPASCPYTIGQSAEGGVIAYILQPGDPGYVSNQQKGLVAATSDFVGNKEWGCFATLIAGADGTAIGTGNQNTIDIMAGCATAGIAARVCGDLTTGGYSDWYLPSIDELQKLYDNRVAIGGFQEQIYWSSTELNANQASNIQFFNGFTLVGDKFNTQLVRAVRSFTCPATPTTTLVPTTTLTPTTTTLVPTTSTTTATPTTLTPTTTTAVPASPIAFTINFRTSGIPYIETAFQTGSNAVSMSVQNSANGTTNWVDTQFSQSIADCSLNTLNDGQKVFFSNVSYVTIPTGSYWRLKQTNNDSSTVFSSVQDLTTPYNYVVYTCNSNTYGYSSTLTLRQSAGAIWTSGGGIPSTCFQIIKYIGAATTGSFYSLSTIPSGCDDTSKCIGVPTTTTLAPTTTTTPVTSFGGCGYGNSVAAACNDATANNRTLYSDCNSGTFGVGCFVYVDTFPNALTGYTNVFMNGANWDVNSSTGQVTAYSSVQC